MMKLQALVLLFISGFGFNATAQNIKAPEYISLGTQGVYDVEIIVFAYNTPLPNSQTYGNKEVFDTSLAYELDFKPDDMPAVKNIKVLDTSEQYTIDIGGEEKTQVLAWFEHEPSWFQLTDIWNKLQSNTTTVPLVHRAWRQPATVFNSPQFVKISNNQIFLDDSSQELTSYPDKTILGQVALSRGRYLHFGNQINLFRSTAVANADDSKMYRSLIFSLTERKQVKSTELHYFDSPWFGTLVKITRYKGESSNE